MAQPYAGYSSYPAPQAGAWAGYPPGSYGAPGGYPPSYTGYDYSSYYQQQPAQYDANYAAWYGQQAQPATGAQAAPVAAPHPPASDPPPLPAEAPPPLPPVDAADAAPPGEAPNPPPPAAAAVGTTPEASTASTGSAAPAQQQYGSSYYADAYTQQYNAAYGSYGYGQAAGAYAQGGYGQQQPSYNYNYSSGQYGSSANPYAMQVPQATSATTNPHPASANGAAGASPVAHAYNRMPPPGPLAAPHKPSTYGSAGSTPAATGSNATPIGSAGAAAAGGSQQQVSLEAMKAAAAAVASRLTAGSGKSQPMYVSVGSAGAAAAAAATAGGAAAEGTKDLPTSLQHYVARALALLGRTNETRLELRTVLRDTIAKHKKEGTMWSTDWDREPLPPLSSQAHLSQPVEASGRQQQQQQGVGGVWDRLGSSKQTSWGSRKRSRQDSSKQEYHNNSDSDRDGSWGTDDEDDGGYGSWGRRKKVDVHGAAGSKKGGKHQQQQQQLGKKGKKGRKHNQWVAGDEQQWTAEEQAKHAARSARFAGQQRGTTSTLAAYGWDEDSMEDAAAAGEFIVGTCQTLEKGYFRLTRAPLPEEVRPEPVLDTALSRLLGMVATKADKYLYYNDQFKAMRQDLTVQGIKNAFTVQVYEAHARAALEYGDGAEYNQCQTQLAILYAAGLPGSHAEFGAYRLLYQSVHAAAGEGRKLLGTMRQLLGNKVGQVADSPEVQHAMQVRQALASSNVSRFFRLYACAPRLGRCIMDVAVKQLRWKGLNTLVRAHKPGQLPLGFMAAALGFLLPDEADPQQQQQPGAGGSPAGAGVGRLQAQVAALTVDEVGQLLPGCSERSCAGENAAAVEQHEGLAACLEWCKRHGAAFESEADLSSCCLVTKDCWSKLFIPEDTSKVAHGDVNLDIRDFLAL